MEEIDRYRTLGCSKKIAIAISCIYGKNRAERKVAHLIMQYLSLPFLLSQI